jgi:hypothetical protein
VPVRKGFVVRVHLGETLVPFRLLDPSQAVLPITACEILDQRAIDNYPDLSKWWTEAENKWNAHKSESDASALLDRIDYHRQLSAQLPAARHRVLYTASGNTLAAGEPEFALTLKGGLFGISSTWRSPITPGQGEVKGGTLSPAELAS